MALITRSNIMSSPLEEQQKTKSISFDLKDIDFLLRKFSELNFNAKEIMVAYSVLAKLQAINTKLLQAEVEVNS